MLIIFIILIIFYYLKGDGGLEGRHLHFNKNYN